VKITSVTIKKEEKENSRMLGYAEVVFDDCLKVNGIRIIKGNTRIFAAMPNRKISDSKYKDYVHPVTQEFRKLIDDAIEEAYNKES
jgi:stage V sporulation protein G